MTGCSALNCSNHSRHGFKFYRFPADPNRRKEWLINCQRGNWNPTQNDRLCAVHFEPSQFERHRVDGKIRLSPFAVPTIFYIPTDPKLSDTTKKRVYKSPQNCTEINEVVQFPKRLKHDFNFKLLDISNVVEDVTVVNSCHT